MDGPHNSLLTPDQVAAFHRDGLLVLRNFYDLETQIDPVRRGIHRIVGLLIRKYALPIEHPPYHADTFDAGYLPLIAHDRAIGGEVYDAVKQLPAFTRFAACTRHDALLMQLRDSQTPGYAMGGQGIRIDNPGEDRYRANWHQDYHAQLRSLDGLVFWSPLIAMTPQLGPVEACIASHTRGPLPVHEHDPARPDAAGAYGLTLVDEAAITAAHEHAAPLLNPADLLLLDYLTVHRSGVNRAGRPRWSVQCRYFNFEDATGKQLAWRGCYAAGVNLRTMQPHLVRDADSPEPAL